MRRRVLIGLAVVLVLAGGFVLARFLALEGAERALVVERVERAAAGDVEVLRVDSATAYSLGDARGPTRIAYRVGGRTEVRCADVERRGSVLSGREVILRGLSDPVALDASC